MSKITKEDWIAFADRVAEMIEKEKAHIAYLKLYQNILDEHWLDKAIDRA